MRDRADGAGGFPRCSAPNADRSAVLPAERAVRPAPSPNGVTATAEVSAAGRPIGIPIDCFPDAVVVVGEDRVILDANEASFETYGWRREQLVGRHVGVICHEPSEPGCGFARALDSGETVQVSTEHKRKDGSRFPAEVAVSKIRLGEDDVVLGIVRDVTARRRWQASQSVLHGIDRRILRRTPLVEILRFVCERLAEVYDARLVQIALKGEDGSVEIRECAGSGAEFLRALRVRWDDSPEGEGPTGTAIRTGKAQRRNLATDPGFRLWRERALELGLESAIALPLVAHGRTAGALTLFTDGGKTYGTGELDELRGFADQVAVSLLAASEQEEIRQQRTALESVANGVLIAGASGAIRWVNPAFTSITGWTLEEVRGRSPRILRSGTHPEAFYREMWETLLAGRVWHGELFNRRKDGALYVQEMTVTPVPGAEGRPESFVAVMKDVTERRKHEESLRKMALHDPLTELPNRRALDAALDRVGRRAGTDGHAAAILLVDVDDFKAVNDAAGHLAGDQVLLDLSSVLRTALRPGDLLVRLGGDEFAALLDGVSAADAAQVAERLRAAVEDAEFTADGRPFPLSVSVGVAPIHGEGDGRDVLRSADRGLYIAKGKGKNCVFVAGPANGTAPAEVAGPARPSRIEDAVERGRLEVHYQPVVRLADGEPVHFEALVRLLDDDGLVILPSEFLGPAEKLGLMTRIDLWVVEEVLSLLSVGGDARVFVNLSGASLSDERVLAVIEDRIRAANLAPGRLAFEITESSAITDLNATRHWIRRLKGLGCLFALDDFGVGFSSFAYLKALPVDYIKIDQSFVRDLATNVTTRAVVDAVQSVARSLGKGVIAEGVESESTAVLLRELGVEHAQGFHWGRPAPADLLLGLSSAPRAERGEMLNDLICGPEPARRYE